MEKLGIPEENCPLAPPPQVSVYTRVLHRWLEGEDDPPSGVFLKAVDLILPTWGPEDDALAKAIAATRPKKGN